MMGMELGRRMRRFFLTIITDFYTCLFTSLNPQDLDRVLEGVDAVVTESMRTDLERPFTSEEVGVAIKEMALLKAPCSDGMPPLFYQTYWTDIGMDVSQAFFLFKFKVYPKIYQPYLYYANSQNSKP